MTAEEGVQSSGREDEGEEDEQQRLSRSVDDEARNGRRGLKFKEGISDGDGDGDAEEQDGDGDGDGDADEEKYSDEIFEIRDCG